ncbi:glycosyl hydrolase family 17 [Lacinutrix sp.]|uniref:glycosyl hydrolase family 17 n=1 Tax=Lacinutrix sp. TaxID=1937692 RepID=UPI00262F3A33|nr:glycosyl hydrolase family 17 [Lacinutrix sp.]MDG1714916.1 glycosyl hydrolase family 17 [Lacinutrix sp.]
MKNKIIIISLFLASMLWSCNTNTKENNATQPKQNMVSAKDILGNPEYLAISYGGYRQKTRDVQPTISELKDDMKLLAAMGIKLLRTYNLQLAQAPNILKAITELKKEDSNFEMYVMLGVWIDCKDAWTVQEPNHDIESEANAGEVDRAVALAKQYPEIVKIIAVGNEAMVRWATSYFVRPNVILKWVTHLQALKNKGDLPKELWITSSDDFSSWGGGDLSYRTEDLEKLIKAVDYVSMHTYPMHNTHYNPQFWLIPNYEKNLSEEDQIEAAMQRAYKFAKNQYRAVKKYVESIDSSKTLHIGETGWATVSNGFYGENGSKATDEYKSGRYYELIRNWTNSAGISCFYFEAFDEQWKDAQNPQGSENHFGLINLKSEAKYAIWDLVDQGKFEGLTRDGKPITKTYNGNKNQLLKRVAVPPLKQ